jgi:hypothetical protein
LVRQPKHRPFRVQVLDIEFRSAMSEHWTKKTINPLVDLVHYKGCLFLYYLSGTYPDWIVGELQELVVTRASCRRSTVVIDGTAALVMPVVGVGEIIGCAV